MKHLESLVMHCVLKRIWQLVGGNTGLADIFFVRL